MTGLFLLEAVHLSCFANLYVYVPSGTGFFFLSFLIMKILTIHQMKGHIKFYLVLFMHEYSKCILRCFIDNLEYRANR